MQTSFIRIAVLVFICVKYGFAGDAITIDGLFEDWTEIPVAYADAAGDGSEDFADFKITNDKDFLFIKIAFHSSKQLLQDLNSIKLFIDTDNNNQTGHQTNGIGAELEWCFGCRDGIYYSSTGEAAIRQADIIIRSAPTITSKEFEIAIGLNSIPMTSGTLVTPDNLSLFLSSSDNTDFVPDASGGFSYVVDTNNVEPLNIIPLVKNIEQHVRMMTYNTLSSGLFDTDRQDHFKKIIQALNPDIMGFQEQSDGNQVKALISNWIQETELYSVELGNGNVVVSKYPVLNQALLTTSDRTMAVLLQTESILGQNLLIINSHLACCANNESRQNDADEIIKIMRNWRSGDGPFPLALNTPIVHLGDFNLVGDSQQLITLTEGDIVNEATFGEDFLPDWDNTGLADLFSRQTSIRMGYTWRNDNSSFSPGKLDYILYSDSNIELGNHFVLNTLAMSQSELDTYGLLSENTNIASDHLPRIMDIASLSPVSIEDKTEIPNKIELYPAYPNPFNSTTNIRYSLSKTGRVSLTVYDLLGKQVEVLVNEIQSAGPYVIQFDAGTLSSGIYLYHLESIGQSKVKKLLLVK
ncbi:MAG: T9SS C-terminal target domain-containing protein [Calditrichaeota bacterium]|nr:MAG: T9SS C-terminal target domain-containing protein [Calditrichota bacterium]MBL1204388.1 T9SS C-terminal target domain-containing protein [Calditrichota bacterium]NOG44217.1 T9SS type A sorting domain-containing protein [Calditrichota bacterium]